MIAREYLKGFKELDKMFPPMRCVTCDLELKGYALILHAKLNPEHELEEINPSRRKRKLG